jgi:murein DD-endopeptidase MepM/ murein hydrolase activator NlpD
VEAVELPNLVATGLAVNGLAANGLAAASESTGNATPLLAAGAVDIAALTLYRSDTTRSSDTADTLLRRLGIDDAAAASFLRSDALTRKSLWGRAGRAISAEANGDHSLKKFVARWTPSDDGQFSRLVVQHTPAGFQSRIETAPLVASTRLASGSINTSLFAATDDARLPDAIATQIAEIFSADIDFHRALRKGDRFSITYETLEGDGEPMRAGRVLSAEFVNNGKKYQAMWFAAEGQGANGKKGAYYTLDGKSLNRAFLASPLEFSRVTSGFKMRLHPILQTWKAHLGVDYAAPTGTPVRSIGDGTVDFAGVQRGFGNVVIVDHGKGNETVYAHLSRIDVRKGEKVSQSQHIGAVGSTGWSTGPHLHFEFRVNGVHQDPLTMAAQAVSKELAAESKAQFERLAGDVKVALAAAGALQRSSAQ